MSEQDAIVFVQERLGQLEKRLVYQTGKARIETVDRINAFRVVISALEKQIPKKPTDTWENNIDRRRNHLCRWACPECGTFLGFENKHCTNCGIKIEWTFIA